MFHIPDIDFNSTCYTLKDCLQEVKDWSSANPDHIPVFISIEITVGVIVFDKNWIVLFSNIDLRNTSVKRQLDYWIPCWKESKEALQHWRLLCPSTWPLLRPWLKRSSMCLISQISSHLPKCKETLPTWLLQFKRTGQSLFERSLVFRGVTPLGGPCFLNFEDGCCS